MRVLFYVLFIFLPFISGCGSGGGVGDGVKSYESSGTQGGGIANGSVGGGSSGDSARGTGILTGYFIDAPVVGLGYATPTIDGVTGEGGAFRYRAGEGVRFFTGGIDIGSVNSVQDDGIVTPQDIVGISRLSISDESVLKIARFLQSLDDDGDISESIKIGSFSGSSSKKVTELNDAEIDSFITSNGKSIVSADSARVHLETSIKDRLSITPFVSEEVVKRYSFDTNISDWNIAYDGACVIEHSTSEGRSGSGALSVRDRAHNYDGPFLGLSGISPDKLYIIRGFVKQSDNTSEAYKLNIKINYGTPQYKEISNITVDDTNWSRFKSFITFTQADIDAGVSLFINNGSTKAFYLDDVEVALSAYTPPGSDGGDLLRIDDSKVVDKSEKEIRIKGVNVIAYSDDQDVSSEEFMNYTYFNVDKHDMQTIRNMGFNAIRVSLWYKYFEDGGVFKDSGFWWLDTLIGWAKEADLYVMLDMHAPQGGGFQGPKDHRMLAFWDGADSQYRDRFLALWQKLSQRYKYEPAIFAYDLLNEPRPDTQDQYMTLLENTVNAIRAEGDSHILNVEVSFVDGEHFLKPFELGGKTNIIYDFHFYDPWDEYTDDESAVYGINDLNASKTRELFEDMSNFYVARNLPFTVSELGQKYDTFVAKNAIEWVGDVLDLVDEKGGNYFYFSYKGNEFGIYKNLNKYSDSTPKNEPLVEVFKNRR